MRGWRGGDRAVCGPPRDAPVATTASVAIRGVSGQQAGQLGWPAAVTSRPVRSAVAPTLAARFRRFEPGALRRPRIGAALPPSAPAALRLVLSAVASALTPRSSRVRRTLWAWCVAPALATRRLPRNWLCQPPESRDAANEWGRMGEGGVSDGKGGWRRTLSNARRWAGGEAQVESRDATRLRVVRRLLLSADRGRLCPSTETYV